MGDGKSALSEQDLLRLASRGWEGKAAADEIDRLTQELDVRAERIQYLEDLINRLATVANTANEYIAAHPCDHPSGCAYRDDVNRAISYAPGRKDIPAERVRGVLG